MLRVSEAILAASSPSPPRHAAVRAVRVGSGSGSARARARDADASVRGEVARAIYVPRAVRERSPLHHMALTSSDDDDDDVVQVRISRTSQILEVN